jgi:hypothetical protein
MPLAAVRDAGSRRRGWDAFARFFVLPQAGHGLTGVERSRRSGRAGRCGTTVLDAIRHDSVQRASVTWLSDLP